MRFVRVDWLTSTMAVMVLILSACGGGGGSGERGEDAGPTPLPTPSPVPGGTAAAPATMSLTRPNEITGDPFNNYFKVDVDVGDTLILRSTLAGVLADQDFARCSANPDEYVGIRLNAEIRSCSLNFRYTFETAGEYRFQLGYPDQNFGYFEVAILPAGFKPAPADDASGAPDAPLPIDFTGDNELLVNDFYNHFAYDAKAGDTLYVQGYLDREESRQDTSRCVSNASYESYYAFGVISDDLNAFSCSSSFERRFEEAGRYYLNFRFKRATAGYFRAVVAESP